MITTINKPIRVIRKIAIAMDHIFTYDDFSNLSVKLLNDDETFYIQKRFATDKTIAAFNISLHQNNWKEILECKIVNEAYITFLDKFSQMYDNFFPIMKITLKSKVLKIPSKRKQQLYNEYLKNSTPKNKREYSQVRNRCLT